MKGEILFSLIELSYKNSCLAQNFADECLKILEITADKECNNYVDSLIIKFFISIKRANI
jgi:hypothetical protein